MILPSHLQQVAITSPQCDDREEIWAEEVKVGFCKKLCGFSSLLMWCWAWGCVSLCTLHSRLVWFQSSADFPWNQFHEIFREINFTEKKCCWVFLFCFFASVKSGLLYLSKFLEFSALFVDFIAHSTFAMRVVVVAMSCFSSHQKKLEWKGGRLLLLDFKKPSLDLNNRGRNNHPLYEKFLPFKMDSRLIHEYYY